MTFGTHLRKHLRLLVGYCETSVTGSHARLDHNVNSESTWSLETSIPQDFSIIEILQNEKYMTKSSKYSTYDLYPTRRFFHYNRNLNYSAAIITIISTSKGVNDLLALFRPHFYLTIRLRDRVFYEQIVNEAQPS